MGDVDDIFIMIYWLIGIILFIFVLDYFGFKPLTDNRKTDKIIKNLRRKKRFQIPQGTGKGIIMCKVGNDSVKDIKMSIMVLRQSNCQLPIIVYYAGDDLSDVEFKDISSLPNTKLIALGPKLDMGVETLHGLQLRAYSLIHSPFNETLMLSPQVLLFGNPEYLFGDPHYTNTGALFWRDRRQWSLWNKKTCDWVRKLIPYRKGDNRILDKKGGDFQTSDILLINKSNHLKTLENLWVLTDEWDTIYNYLPGDKECYWISAELAKEPYHFVDHYPGAIGEVRVDRLIGSVLHLDPSGQLLGMTGQGQFADYTHYSLFVRNAEWSGDTLKGGDHQWLSTGLKELLNSFAKILHDL